MDTVAEPTLVCRHGCCWGTKTETSCELCPIVGFYEASLMTLPHVDRLTAEQIPEPYRQLLAHDRDMTSTLEEFHGARTHLRVLRHNRTGSVYQREVVLELDGSGRAVEFGAIAMRLDLFEAEMQQMILMARRPLGAILQQFQMPFSSRPKSFVTVESDRLMNEIFGLSGRHRLYGRCNALYDGQDRLMADIVEILPPEVAK
jgi:chorismate-pyruvate lyase